MSAGFFCLKFFAEKSVFITRRYTLCLLFDNKKLKNELQ